MFWSGCLFVILLVFFSYEKPANILTFCSSIYTSRLISLTVNIVPLSLILSNLIIICLTTAFLYWGFTEILYLWVNNFQQIRKILAIISSNMFLPLPSSPNLDMYFTFPMLTVNEGLEYHHFLIPVKWMNLVPSLDGC